MNLRMTDSGLPRYSTMFTKRISQITDGNLMDLVLTNSTYDF